jgi:hypothetical protein
MPTTSSQETITTPTKISSRKMRMNSRARKKKMGRGVKTGTRSMKCHSATLTTDSSSSATTTTINNTSKKMKMMKARMITNKTMRKKKMTMM